jgi:hypothetical protein
MPLFALFAEQDAATAALTKKYERLLDPTVRPSLNGKGLWLVRPDGYVACSANDTGAVATYLDGIVRPSLH